jgi:dolichol-phosphate mannosyltransferase
VTYSGIDHAAERLETVSVVVPTYREVESLPHLLDRLRDLREAGVALDVLVMDDDSQDGTEALIAARGEPWVELVVRTRDRGLSPSVLDGLQRAKGDVLVVMDADLSHPPERIPAMIQALREGSDLVIGSRYVEGGTTSHDWGFGRWLNSRVATLLARPFTHISDPMSGFIALRRSTFRTGRDFNPVGYKIGLELIVKCGCKRVGEVPIHFENRKYGESKLSLREQLKYLQHLRRLAIYKYGTWSHLTQFAAVGALGALVNLVLLTALLRAGVPARASVATAIGLSMVFNFVLNRRFSFSYARGGSIVRHFFGFMAACSLGALLNYAITLTLMRPAVGASPQIAALVGIAAGSLLNFLTNRYLVFRQQHVRP